MYRNIAFNLRVTMFNKFLQILKKIKNKIACTLADADIIIAIKLIRFEKFETQLLRMRKRNTFRATRTPSIKVMIYSAYLFP